MGKVKLGLSLLLLSASASAFSAEVNNNLSNINVDYLFKNANLERMVGTKTILNLAAQTLDPEGSTDKINDLNDFIVLTVKQNRTIIAEFNRYQKLIGPVITYDMPWMGVQRFDQKELKTFSNGSYQDGLQAVRMCMAKQGEIMPKKISRFIIYKTINTDQIVYDYVFKYPSGGCREALYIPRTGECEQGMKTSCHDDLSELMMHNSVSARVRG